MPALTTVNLIEAIKPGATTLLSATDERRRERVVLAYERYGRGKSIAFPVQDSWHWQMDATIRVEDQTHENFWRQLLRWLVDGVPDAVETRSLTDRVEPGQPVDAHRRRRRQAVRRAERRERRRARHVAVGQDRRRCRCSGPASGTVSTAPTSRPASRAGTRRSSTPRARARASAPPSRTSAPYRTTRSTSTRRCTRRCSSGSRRTRAAASTPADAT